MEHQNFNNQITPPDSSEKTPFYKTTWFILLTMFCICFPVGLFLMWKYKKFHVGVRITLTSVFTLLFLVSFAGAIFSSVGSSARRASSSAYSEYEVETSAYESFETTEETTADTFEYKTEETTGSQIAETTTEAAIPETTAAAGTFGSSNETVLDVSTGDLIDAYDADTTKGDDLYKGKALRFTGTVYSVNTDSSDRVSVSFEHSGKWTITMVSCYFTDSAEIAKVSKLLPGDTVTVSGLGDGYFANVILKDCKIQ